MKLLFLDIDGVLNPHSRWENGYSPICNEQVVHLNFILESIPELQIVLSSAWRYTFHTAFLAQQVLCIHGINAFSRVHGVTERDPESKHHPPYSDTTWWDRMGLTWRSAQIRDYVKKTHPERYAVLDDLPLEIEFLFQTNGGIGLTLPIAETVVGHFQT